MLNEDFFRPYVPVDVDCQVSVTGQAVGALVMVEMWRMAVCECSEEVKTFS